jgi:hypothetical protein
VGVLKLDLYTCLLLLFSLSFLFAFAVYRCLHGVGSDLALASTRPKSVHSSVIYTGVIAPINLPLQQMPHREWFKSYTPCKVAIRVANGQVVYAAGRGTVEFAPVKGNRKLRPVLFSEVLHDLNQNLLSVLTITSVHGFFVLIKPDNIMEFIKDRIPRFYASVGADRVALLSGSTVVQSEVASPAQGTGYELGHCCFGHITSNHWLSMKWCLIFCSQLCLALRKIIWYPKIFI